MRRIGGEQSGENEVEMQDIPPVNLARNIAFDVAALVATFLEPADLIRADRFGFFQNHPEALQWQHRVFQDITETPRLQEGMTHREFYLQAYSVIVRLREADAAGSADMTHQLFAELVINGYDKLAPYFAQRVNLNREIVTQNYEANRAFLHKAAAQGNDALVRWMLENGASVDPQGDLFISAGEAGSWVPGLGNTPLKLACCYNQVNCVRTLLEFNADPNLSEPLHAAAERGHIECVRLVLAANPDLTRKEDYSEKTAYELARDNNHPECAELIRTKMDELDLEIPQPSSGCSIL